MLPCAQDTGPGWILGVIKDTRKDWALELIETVSGAIRKGEKINIPGLIRVARGAVVLA